MNWTALGAIGELVGGAVVVITLIYLAAQIRQYTRATMAQATAFVASEMERNLLAVAENAELAEAFTKAARGEDLAPVEGTRLLFWWSSFVRTADSHIAQSKLGTLSEDVVAPTAIVLRQFVEIPVLRNSLQEMIDRKVQGKAFRDWVLSNVLS